MRVLPSPLYGVTVDDITNLNDIVASSRALGHMPVTRVYFNVRKPASYYAAPLRTLQPVSYVMGELLDSSDSRHIGTGAYNRRVKSYLTQLGSSVDVWEIGNEVNGNWTGRYSKVEDKLTSAYDDVTAAGRRTALTLYYNIGCGDGPRELDPIAFSDRYVPTTVRNGLDYVLLSYYEANCNGIRPSAVDMDRVLRPAPHALSPRPARLRRGRNGQPRHHCLDRHGPLAHDVLLRPPHRPPVLRGRLLLVVLRRGLPAVCEQAVVGNAAEQDSPSEAAASSP